MKKEYLKPEAEYVSLEAEDVITDIIDTDQDYLPGESSWED
jgi:hypothetical protein